MAEMCKVWVRGARDDNLEKIPFSLGKWQPTDLICLPGGNIEEETGLSQAPITLDDGAFERGREGGKFM